MQCGVIIYVKKDEKAGKIKIKNLTKRKFYCIIKMDWVTILSFFAFFFKKRNKKWKNSSVILNSQNIRRKIYEKTVI